MLQTYRVRFKFPKKVESRPQLHARLTLPDGGCETLGMGEAIYLPITEPEEVAALLDELPLAVDRDSFVGFVRGFPRGYLVNTPRLEIVKHYLLRQNLGDKQVISSLSPQNGSWRLILLTRDRRKLFSRITGTLSCFGMDISLAEAFSNANSMALDTFIFRDPHDHLHDRTGRETFQHLVEEVVEGSRDVKGLFREHLEEVPFADFDVMEIAFDNDIHPASTKITMLCRDHIGLTFLLSDCLAREEYSIQMAYVSTVEGRSEQQYYVQHNGEKLTAEMQLDLSWKLNNLGEQLAVEYS